MNIEKFFNIAGPQLSQNIVEIIDNNELVSSTLCVHLVCEKLLEAWICSSCNQDNFFYDGEDRIIVDFSAKLKIAKVLNLPKPLYETIKKINTIRNVIAHTQSIISIDNKHFDSIAYHLDSWVIDSDTTTLSERYIDINEKNSGEKRYLFKEASTPDKYKLLIILLILIQKIFVTVQKN